MKIEVPTYNKKKLPLSLQLVPITKPGTRYLR